MGDERLLLRQLQTPFGKEFGEQALYLHGDLGGFAGNDEIIRVPREVRLSEIVPDQPLHPVEGHVRKNRRDDAPLGTSAFGREQTVPIDVSRLDELPQNVPVHGYVPHHPLVGYVVEASLDVPFQDPLGPSGGGHHEMYLGHGVLTRPSDSEPVGVRVGRRLLDGVQGQRVQRLHGAVVHGRDGQRTLLSVPLGDVHASQGLRTVSSRVQSEHRVHLGFGREPKLPVHARGVSSPVLFRNPPHRQESGAEGVHQ